MAGGTKSLGRGKGCLRLHFERFDKNGYFVKFYNFKSDFFFVGGGGEETNYFILRFYVKDNVNLMSLLKITN